MIRWTGLAPWVFEFPSPGGLISTFLMCSIVAGQRYFEDAHSHALTHSHTHTHSLTHTHAHYLSHTHSLSFTHTHTHSQQYLEEAFLEEDLDDLAQHGEHAWFRFSGLGFRVSGLGFGSGGEG